MPDGKSTYQIAGAGPAGLAAAITLAAHGRRVVVHEMREKVGYRFRDDFQGLENWTTEEDVLESFRELGITTDFRRTPCYSVTAFDAWRKSYEIKSSVPLLYMVERGSSAGSFDIALLEQARSCGVEVRFGSRIDSLNGPGVYAEGPGMANILADGYHFKTSMPDGFRFILDSNLAPRGYAYLLIINGRGNVKSCMPAGFRHKKEYVKRTVEAFKKLAGMEMIDPKPHGGVGSARMVGSALDGIHPIAGEQAGFQDHIWGFGMRMAVISGVLAARSLLDGANYDGLWKRELGGFMSTSAFNRFCFCMFGNRGYRRFLRRFSASTDVRSFLHGYCRPSPIKSLIAPLLVRRAL